MDGGGGGGGCSSNEGCASGSMQCMGLEDDPLTALTLAPPGIGGGSVADRQTESVPAGGFWDAMRDVIAREVRDYVTTNFSENSGFH